MLKTSETKPFYLTSEFWLLVIGTAVTMVGELPISSNIKATIVVVLGAAYTVSRGLAKSGTPYEPQEGEKLQPTEDDSVPLGFPGEQGGGAKGVEASQNRAVGTEQAYLDRVREILTEHPEVVQALKSEGVIS